MDINNKIYIPISVMQVCECDVMALIHVHSIDKGRHENKLNKRDTNIGKRWVL